MQSLENAIEEQLTYDPVSGDIAHSSKCRMADGRKKPTHGKIVKTMNSGGYVQIGICLNGKSIRILGHRAAWVLHNGKFPDNQIDHINGNRVDNRISNLRDVDCSTNNTNRSKKVGRSQNLPVGVSEKHQNGKTNYRVCCWKGSVRKSTTVANLLDAVKLRAKYEKEVFKNPGESSAQRWLVDRCEKTIIHNVGIAEGVVAP